MGVVPGREGSKGDSIMAFQYDLSAIKNHETLCFAEGESTGFNPVTNYILWGTLLIGIDRITDANAAEAYARFKVAHKMWAIEGSKFTLTMQDVRDHIGMKTNAQNETRSEWLKRIKDSIKRDLDLCESEARRELADAVIA
jgi:hypothetical protein